MASIAHERLWKKLCYIDTLPDNEATTSDIAEAMLDGWSIVDAAHRFLDAIGNFPGLRNSTWRELATRRLTDADTFRNSWQHFSGNETLQTTLGARGQVWGSIGWVKHHEGHPKTWFVAIAGTILKGTESLFIGPHQNVDRVDSRRIRLFHGDDEFYLTRAVNDIFKAIAGLEDDLRSGRVTLRGDQIDQDRGSDIIYEGYIEVMHAFVEDCHAEAETKDSNGISQK
ncbi:hypothetical protein NKI77_18115 [Mesorhizobium opportunistum]|uniref:Uncharacterized protein n=1 Tax=Mesorhizobium opportunistum TaxID=593909 RepID=A0ABV1YBH5_9HYPH